MLFFRRYINPLLRFMPCIVVGCIGWAQPGSAAELDVKAAGRGGKLLPTGWISTQGSRIVDEQGHVVRIASIGWYGTDGPAGFALQGLWSVSYRVICDSIVAAGFNTVRIPWSDVNLDVKPLNTVATGTIDYQVNPELIGLTNWQIFGKIVDYAGEIGLRVIFDHHTNDGGGGQQPNGLWFDRGPGSDGTDGAGHRGTISADRFKADWVRFAKQFAHNPTVIGFDLDNEPHTGNWGKGGPTDIWAMYTDVGNAIQAANPDVLIICEGLQVYRSVAPEGDLRPVKQKPVDLHTPNKVVYSVHSYPPEISGGDSTESAAATIARYEQGWGFLARQDRAPVWIGELGASNPGPGGSAHQWAVTLIGYMNGFSPPLSGSWWNIGNEAPGANPNGLQTAWGVGHYRPEQLGVTDQILFRP
jgi:aryl-phospho-beta-D-glucosidase BglC (GH1 family)